MKSLQTYLMLKKVQAKQAFLFVLGLFFASLSYSQNQLDIKVFLEGPYQDNQMTPFLNVLDYLPSKQPYYVAPFNYGGIESVIEIPNENVIDWILFELRESPGDASTADETTTIYRSAAFLMDDGTIRDLDGVSLPEFSQVIQDNLYIAIFHRNHLSILSNDPLSENAGVYSYDFTTNADQSYLGELSVKNLGNGYYGMPAGNGYYDLEVENKDKDEIWFPQYEQYGYYEGDYNMNGQVDDEDHYPKWFFNAGRSSKINVSDWYYWECGMSFMDSRDQQIYQTVQIGTQCWMAENLNIGTRINGSNDQSDDGIIEKYCYDDIEANCDEYGGLYQWDEMMQYSITPGLKGICPEGWHLPNTYEWCIMELYLDPTIQCTQLGWRGTDGGTKLMQGGSSGFDALLAGSRHLGNFIQLNEYAYFWTSSEDGTYGNYRSLYIGSSQVRNENTDKLRGNSVRCILGDSVINLPPEVPANPSPEQGATGIFIDTILAWSCEDPEGLPLTYNLYLGLNSDPPLFQTGISDTFFSPGLLNFDSTYYWRVVAIDLEGDSTSGTVWSFTLESWSCGYPIEDARDGQLYETVEIGTQCWMAESLNIGTMINGSNGQSDDGIIEKYCYDDIEANCDEYGGLYQWDEMMQYNNVPGKQGVCPDGWHLPTDIEWYVLEYFVDPTISLTTGWRGIDGGGKLKETGTTHWQTPNTGATNSSGFTALPGGFRDTNGDFNYLTSSGGWWSSAGYNSSDAWDRSLENNKAQAYRYHNLGDYGFSVRCILGDSVINLPPEVPANPSPEQGATGIFIDTILAWSCEDPEGLSLTYNLYLGLNSDPLLFQTGISDTFFSPGLLNFDSTYYWRVVAIDIEGDSTSGPVWSFTTGSWVCGYPFEDARDGQNYETVQIGNQCWMAENLNIGTMINASEEMSDDGIIERYCYDNNTANCVEYGGLYQWDEMMQYYNVPGKQGICPEGWHLPTDTEWMMLEEEVESSTGVNWNTTGWRGTDAGGNLKETGTTHWQTPNTGATNSRGFTALPGGFRDSNGDCDYLTYYGYLWSSNEYGTRCLSYDKAQVARYTNMTYGFSVRCILGDSTINLPPEVPENPSPGQGTTGISIDTILAWSCEDPEGLPLTYNLYLGLDSDPPLFQAGISDTLINPGSLHYDSTYYWRVVAIDLEGDSTSGPVWSFTTEHLWVCGDPFTDPRDGQNYETVQIGFQCWMSENINVGSMIDGTQNMLDNGIIEKYCYDNDIVNCDSLGGLYKWDEMMQYVIEEQALGICPVGWHIPSDEEWKQLEGATDNQYYYPDPEWDGEGWRGLDAGLNLKSASGWNSGGNGINLYGFTALPSGTHGSDGSFSELGLSGFWWSSSEGSSTGAWRRKLSFDENGSYRSSNNKAMGRSVRCIQNTTTVSWACGDTLVDPRDGGKYKTVQIGDQCWMAQNLNIGTMINGSNGQSNDGIIEKYCYDDNTSNCDTYGGLYQWNEAMQYVTTDSVQGICPDGWYFPTDYDWMTLEEEVESTSGVNWNIKGWRGTDAGGNLKETGTTHWISPNTGATNLSGFTGLPGGCRWSNGSFDQITNYAFFWSSSKNEGNSNVKFRALRYIHANIFRETNNLSSGFSIRCILGEGLNNQFPAIPSDPIPFDGADNVNLECILQWSCSDPDGDSLLYKIYFGTDPDPGYMANWSPDTSYTLSPLTFSTTYYWKIIAKDPHNFTTEGPVWSFTTMDDPCGNPFTDTRDGKNYATVVIGSQCWMAENLNIGTMINGSSSQNDNGTIEKYCYDDNTANCDEYGGLYQWDEMMEYSTTQGTQGICPEDWHLPDDLEYFFMEQYVDSTIAYNSTGYRGTNGGGKLKEAGTTHWQDPNTGATNESGFTALPGGIRHVNGSFASFPTHSLLWSSTESGSDAWHRVLVYNSAQVKRSPSSIDYGFNVRCVRDMDVSNSAPLIPANPSPADGAVEVSILEVLSWWCADPNGEALTYDFYLGTNQNPPLIQQDLTESQYDPVLSESQTYYWKVVAKDGFGNQRVSPVWSFETGETFEGLFIKSYGDALDDYGTSLTLTNDGGIALTGYSDSYTGDDNDMLLLKLDDAGNAEWGNTYGWGHVDESYAIEQTNDNGFILFGENYYNGHNLMYVKTDPAGNVEWQWLWDYSYYDYGNDIIQNNDNEYVIAASTHAGTAEGGNVLIQKITEDGSQEVWGWIMGGDNYESAEAVVKDVYGGYAFAGHTTSFGNGHYDVYFIKVEEDGSSPSAWSMGGTEYEYGNDLVQADNGDFVIAGSTSSYGAGSADFYIRRIDNDVNSVWAKTYGFSTFDIAFAITTTNDQGFVVAGRTGGDIMIIKINSLGDFQWGQIISGTESEIAFDVKQANDGHIYVVGWTTSWGADEYDIILFKCKPDGTHCLLSKGGYGKDNEFSSSLDGISVIPIERINEFTIDNDEIVMQNSKIEFINKKPFKKGLNSKDLNVTPISPNVTTICD